MSNYTNKDINLMSWNEFGDILDLLVSKLIKFQQKEDIKFDLIVPILRSWWIPWAVIANQLDIINTLPVQFKCINNQNK